MDSDLLAPVVCGWLATYFAHSTLLLGAVWATTRKLSPRFDRVAEEIWRAALVLPFATSLAQLLLASSRDLGGATVGAIAYAPKPVTVNLVPATLWISFALAWLGGAIFLLGRLYLCHRQVHRRISARTPLPAQREDLLRDLIRPAGTHISVVADLDVPCALLGEICLPGWLTGQMSVGEFRAVVAHELAHVRRRDAFWRPTTSALARIGFFQPLNWMAVARLRELSECICDEEAVGATRSRIPLAAALELVARRTRRRHTRISLAPALGAPVSLTVKRVARLVTQPARAPQRGIEIGGIYRAGALIIAAAIAVVFAPRLSLPSIAFTRYTINAQDPAGPFTVTVEKGRVIGATIGGRPLPPPRVRQREQMLELLDDAGVLSLRMTPEGGIQWNARKPARNN